MCFVKCLRTEIFLPLSLVHLPLSLRIGEVIGFEVLHCEVTLGREAVNALCA